MLRNLPDNAPGPDNLPYGLFKLAAGPIDQMVPNPDNFLGKYLMVWLNLLFSEDSAAIPRDMKGADIIPLLKGGDPTDTNNYRGISLMPCVVKIVASLVERRLSAELEEAGFFFSSQAGFRPEEESTAHFAALFEICKRRSLRVDGDGDGNQTWLAFIDFRKAYDSVPHEALFLKLRKLGLPLKILQFIINLYTDAWICVRIGDERSAEFPLGRGLRQGCPLSPLLFNIFINDLLLSPSSLENGSKPRNLGVEVPGFEAIVHEEGRLVNSLMFADDVVLLAPSREMLVLLLARVTEWADRWMMEVNHDKCGLLVVFPEYAGKKLPRDMDNRPVLAQSIAVQRGEIKAMYEYKYLGLWFNDHLDLDEINHRHLEKVRGMVYGYSKVLSNPHIPVQHRVIWVKSFVLPVFLFGMPFLGTSSERIKGQRNLFMSLVQKSLGAAEHTSIGTLLGHFSLPDLGVLAQASVIRVSRKWPGLKSVISKLFQFRATPGHVNGTYTSEVDRCVKACEKSANESGIPMTGEFNGEQYVGVMMGKALRDGALATISAKQQIEWSLLESLCALKKTQWCGSTAPGLGAIWQLRLGCFWTCERMARFGEKRVQKVCQKFVDYCPFCGSQEPETVQHLFLSCSAWNGFREFYLRGCFSSLESQPHYPVLVRRQCDEKDPSIVPQAVVGALLGGCVSGFTLADYKIPNGEERVLFCMVSRFLSAVLIRRSEFFSNAEAVALSSPSIPYYFCPPPAVAAASRSAALAISYSAGAVAASRYVIAASSAAAGVPDQPIKPIISSVMAQSLSRGRGSGGPGVN